jgi:hypothetical protein
MRSSKKQEIQVGDLVKWVTMSRTKAGVAAIVHRGIVSSIIPGRTAIVIEQGGPRDGKIYSPWLSRLKVAKR